jgi:valyl-tRNA synthetase
LYKPETYGEEKRKAAQYTLYTVLFRVLQLLAPITPHVTEEIYQTLYAEHEGARSVNLSSWPAVDEKRLDEEAEKRGDVIAAVIDEIRREKSEKHMPLNASVKRLTVYAEGKDFAASLMDGKEDIAGTCKVQYFEILLKKGEGREVKPLGKIRFVAEY